MYLHWLILSLSLVWWVSADQVCNSSEYDNAHAALFENLGLFNDKSLVKYIRPVTKNTDAIMVYILLFVTSITDVNEKAQSITTQLKIYTWWTDMRMDWDSSKYCNIYSFITRKDLFWTPNIAVQESIKTEFAAAESQYVEVRKGSVSMEDILSLTTACSMDLYRFPFDTQVCSLTFRSFIYRDYEIDIFGVSDSTSAYKQSFKIPGEWQLLDITQSVDHRGNVIYKMTIRRKPLVYVINLIFPVFCFLVLDVASFFINAAEADKLSFKVTLLLSISVLLQVLNDRLTATSSDIPLIGVYCGVIFTLIGFSILETILVNILIAKGEKAKSVTPEETRAAETGQNDHVNDLNNSPETIENEEPTCMIDIGKKSSLWTRAAKIIDVTYIVLYISTIIVFLSIIGKIWLQL
ncbi:5-hydroxytryptamine receptor 3A-like [Triplophysa rosa]|nr:5-hydroxytryptamine receptor 3A-like [Triplophysa rosa]